MEEIRIMSKVLKIYIIEDAKKKIENMKKYFDGVNWLLGNRDVTVDYYKDSDKTLRKRKYTKVVLEAVKTKNEEAEYYNFDYQKNKDFLKKVEEILRNEEHRIFILDLALNHKERSDFQLDQNKLQPKSAIKILEIIGRSPFTEVVIVSSRYTGIEDEYLQILEIDKDKLKDKIFFEFLPANVFNNRCTEKEMTISVNEVLEEVFKKNEQFD